MRNRGLCCRPASIHPSHAFVYCIHATEDFIRLLSLLANPVILVFCLHAPLPNFKGNPFSGGVKYTEGWENVRFSTEISVYLCTRMAHVCDGGIGSHWCRIDPYRFR